MPMTPGLRKLTLAAHLTVSVGWIGAVAAYLALDLLVALGRDPQVLVSGYVGMDRIMRYVIVPLAIASLLTGILISVGTTWGLFRHYWVVISLTMTTFAAVVVLREMRVVGSLAEVATDPGTSVQALEALGGTLVHSVGGMVVLLVVLVLNVFKPRGMTRFGHRAARRERGRTGRGAGI